MDRYDGPVHARRPPAATRAPARCSPTSSGFPPAYVATALADPLARRGRGLRAAAARRRRPRRRRSASRSLHGFFNMTVHRAARDAVAVTAGALRAGLR